MSSAIQNKSIARLIVGAMSIDGVLDKNEQNRVAAALSHVGMGELIADVGAAIKEDPGDLNMFADCKELIESLGNSAKEVAPLIFRIISDIVAADRFVSAQEATYLSGVAKQLGLSGQTAQGIFKQVMADRRAKIEISGKSIDAAINPFLKELLSFSGADSLVTANAEEFEPDEDDNFTTHNISTEDLERAFAVLGLESDSKLYQAEKVWRETIQNLDLPKMADLGETFVSAAINRISRINEAYKTVLSAGTS